MIDLQFDDANINAVTIREITCFYEEIIAENIVIIIKTQQSGVCAHAKEKSIELSIRESSIAKTAKLAVYLLLKEITGISLPWGSLTGVKPLKKMQVLLEKNLSAYDRTRYLRDTFCISDEKIALMDETAHSQKHLLYPPKNSVGLYIHIPLCISKCTYCSFPSSITKEGSSLCEKYLAALCTELDAVQAYMKNRGLYIDNVYIGGGTPSVLSIRQIKVLMRKVLSIADQSPEISFEAGRCDTLTVDKLKCLKDHKVSRISLNPQTTNNNTLNKINRGTSYEDFLSCYENAMSVGLENINCDLILGLEDENEKDYIKSLSDMLLLHPANITLHTLCLKRTSDLNIKEVYANQANISDFLDDAKEILKERGYHPYYLYKQKNAISGSENVGYSLKNKECIYNIRMMGEKQTILSAGASSSTKVYYKELDSYKNVYNVKDLDIYTNKIDQIIAKKFQMIENIEKSFNSVKN